MQVYEFISFSFAHNSMETFWATENIEATSQGCQPWPGCAGYGHYGGHGQFITWTLASCMAAH